MKRSRCSGLILAGALAHVVGQFAIVCSAQDTGRAQPTGKMKYRGLLGFESKKVKQQEGKTLLWSGGGSTTSPDAEWYDFTGAPIPPAELQFGIGKDRIRAIDDPVFVLPDDPRLLKLPPSRYRRDPRPKANDDIIVMGYIGDGEARAYPVGLLDHHELVNDEVGGKRITAGW